jgi:hypothetical protein
VPHGDTVVGTAQILAGRDVNRQSVAVTLLLRAVVFSLLFAAAVAGSYLGGDPLALGLLVFAAFVVMSMVWGFRDGRTTSFGRASLVWLLVTLPLGIVMTLVPWLLAEGNSASTIAGDLVRTLPFVLAIVTVPAVLGAAVGDLRRRTAG